MYIYMEMYLHFKDYVGYICIETYLHFEAEVFLLKDIDFLLHRIPVDKPVTQPQLRAIEETQN